MNPRRACLALVVGCSLALSWLLMQAVHELGHVLHAWLSGGSVVRVVLDPREISHTDLGSNPHPSFVAWGGLLWGAALPAALLLLSSRPGQRIRHLLRFFAGFCLVANGAYLAGGTLARAGDPADLMRLGAPAALLLVAGSLVAAAGLLVWHRLGPTGGFGVHAAATACRTAVVLVGLLALLLFACWSS